MARHTVHQGRKITVQLDVTTQPDGSELRRDVILHPGAVVIVPLIDSATVCLLRNYRFVIEQTLWEVPAGTLEPGETPEATARRELLEETGYVAQHWRKLGQFYASPGVLNEIMHLFLAHDLTPGPAQPEAGEEIEVHQVPLADALRWCVDGTIRDLKTITALLLIDRLATDRPGASA
jgi:ADP-ribose pyrophosphatase